MELTEQGIKDRLSWEKGGYALPKYDRALIRQNTKETPFWIHFGAGNLFRAFHANVIEKLLNFHLLTRGIILAEGFDYEIIERINHPHDDLTILATLKANGSLEKTVIGSIMESLILDTNYQQDYTRLKEIFCKESLQMATFTITEKGYQLINASGSYLPAVTNDLKNGPTKPESYLGKVTSLLYVRYLSNEKPIAMISMDNCSHNGSKLQKAIVTYAKAWCDQGLTKPGFLDYIMDDQKVSFPWTMIDKITPRPDETVKEQLVNDGVLHLEPIITSKHTYIAPYVNSEECEYLVIEDTFPNGRPPLEQGGLFFTTRDTVEKAEKMKVCTCLNPLHTSLAIFGCLLGYQRIFKEMEDPDLRQLAEQLGYHEGLPVVTDPGILNPREFLDTVLQSRIPNPFLPDTPQRIATDTSQKLAIRFGETIKAYAASPTLSVSDLKLIPFIFAGWLRYLMAIDDQGQSFELSPDPLLKTICPRLQSFSLGMGTEIEPILRPILENATIFGVNLYEVQMAPLVCKHFSQMIEEPAAVRKTLHKTVSLKIEAPHCS